MNIILTGGEDFTERWRLFIVPQVIRNLAKNKVSVLLTPCASQMVEYTPFRTGISEIHARVMIFGNRSIETPTYLSLITWQCTTLSPRGTDQFDEPK